MSTLNVNLQKKSTLFSGFRGPNAKFVFDDGKLCVLILMVEFRTPRKAVVNRIKPVLIRPPPGFQKKKNFFNRRKPVENPENKYWFLGLLLKATPMGQTVHCLLQFL
jgi:hypothetical protein